MLTILLALVLTADPPKAKLSETDARAVEKIQAEASKLSAAIEIATRDAEIAKLRLGALEQQFNALIERIRPKDCAGCTLTQDLEWKRPELPKEKK